MSNLRRIMQQELEAIDRRMEHLAAERGRIVEAMKVLSGEMMPPTIVTHEVDEHVHTN